MKIPQYFRIGLTNERDEVLINLYCPDCHDRDAIYLCRASDPDAVVPEQRIVRFANSCRSRYAAKRCSDHSDRDIAYTSGLELRFHFLVDLRPHLV
ncbi:MAG: hypothetical protein KDB27_03090 [Planctomycetales bacterium]|nr:hypothetical protein [Planctomycetales bacterium]